MQFLLRGRSGVLWGKAGLGSDGSRCVAGGQSYPELRPERRELCPCVVADLHSAQAGGCHQDLTPPHPATPTPFALHSPTKRDGTPTSPTWPPPLKQAAWKPKPVSLNIPASTRPVRIQLEGTPLLKGMLVLTGCRCADPCLLLAVSFSPFCQCTAGRRAGAQAWQVSATRCLSSPFDLLRLQSVYSPSTVRSREALARDWPSDCVTVLLASHRGATAQSWGAQDAHEWEGIKSGRGRPREPRAECASKPTSIETARSQTGLAVARPVARQRRVGRNRNTEVDRAVARYSLEEAT